MIGLRRRIEENKKAEEHDYAITERKDAQGNFYWTAKVFYKGVTYEGKMYVGYAHSMDLVWRTHCSSSYEDLYYPPAKFLSYAEAVSEACKFLKQKENTGHSVTTYGHCDCEDA